MSTGLVASWVDAAGVAGLRPAVSRWMQSRSANHRFRLWNAVRTMMGLRRRAEGDAPRRPRQVGIVIDAEVVDTTGWTEPFPERLRQVEARRGCHGSRRDAA